MEVILDDKEICSYCGERSHTVDMKSIDGNILCEECYCNCHYCNNYYYSIEGCVCEDCGKQACPSCLINMVCCECDHIVCMSCWSKTELMCLACVNGER